MQVSNPVLVFFLVRDLSRASKQKKASSSIFRALRPHSRASVNCWMALACISQVSRQQPDLGIEHDGLAFCLPSPVRFEFDGGQTRLQQFPKQISNRDKLQTPVQKSTGASEGGFSDVKSTTHRTPRKLSERMPPAALLLFNPSTCTCSSSMYVVSPLKICCISTVCINTRAAQGRLLIPGDSDGGVHDPLTQLPLITTTTV